MNKLGKHVVMGLFAILVGGLLCLNAQAGEGHGHGPAAFTDFDLNGDGSISETEFNSVREQRMAARAAEGKKMHCVAHAPTFAGLDADSNGELSADELSAGQQAHMEKCRAMRQQSGAGAGKGGHHHTPRFEDYDIDGNGVISEQEFDDAHVKKMSAMASEGHQMKHVNNMPSFESIDTNGDGGISEEEFDDHVAARHAHMQHKQQMPQEQD